MWSRSISALVLLIFLVMGHMLAQTEIRADYLTIEDGLSQGFVPVIHQDQEGFLWFATKNGLNRYDGANFEVYTHDPDDPYSITDDFVEAIHEEGDFLVLTNHSEYLNLFHKRSQKFYRIPLRTTGVKPFELALELIKDEQGVFWLNTINSKQFLKIEFPETFWTDFPNDSSLLRQVKVDLGRANFHLHSIIDKTQFVVEQEYKYWKYDRNTTDLDAIAEETSFKSNTLFYKILPKVGLGTTTDVGNNRQLKLHVFRTNEWQKLNSDLEFLPFHYYDNSSNLVWMQQAITDDLLAFDMDLILQTEVLKKEDATYLVDNIDSSIFGVCKDRSGLLWLGTAGKGVRKLSPRKLAIQTYLPDFSIGDNIFATDEGEILYYNPGATTLYYKPGKSSELSPVHEFLEGFPMGDISQFSYHKDNRGSSWLAAVGKYANKTIDELRLYSFSNPGWQERFRFSLGDYWGNSELSLLSAPDNKLYISTYRYLIQYNPVTEEVNKFEIDVFQDIRPAIFQLARTANGHFWIGTSQGLVQGKPKASGFEFTFVQGLRNPVCASLLADPEDADVLWIGTKGGGLHRLDTRTMEFQYLSTKDGLPNDVIYAVMNDEQGNLWMSSNKGIIRFDPVTGTIGNFTAEDGMQSDEFNTYAFGKTAGGELLFGGIKGLNLFDPDDLTDNSFVPEVRITDLEINNEQVSVRDSNAILSQAIEYTKELTLAFHQNSFTLTLAGLEFTAPGKNSFSYYLEGAEEPWAHTTVDRRAPYLKLAPGKYTFLAKAANGDGVWNEKITALAITILPPWYRTTLAWIIYAFLFIAGIWSVMRFQRDQLQLKHNLALEQKESDKLKELNAFRSKLYTNITHEFRTPITVIQGTAKQLETQKSPSHPEQKQLSLIQRSGSNLLHLVNQLLDLSKLEHDGLSIHYEHGEIVRYLRYITDSFNSLANFNNILLRFESQQGEIWMDYDPEKMRQILSNLLSNAIKYTSSGGKIVISLSEIDQQLEIQVKDTGIGIPAAALPQIFDRFFQANNNTAKVGGTGIGLALTKELIELLGGSIRVQSQEGQGTTFTVRLPIQQQASTVATTTAWPINGTNTKVASPLNTSLKIVPKVLIIEDSPEVIEFLSNCLSQDYQLSLAFNGEAGIEKALEEVPDIIISDVMMPGKTGFEVTEWLKNDERTSHIPIVLLTAKVDVTSRIAGLQQGADVYLHKPFHQGELLAYLENLLQTRQKLQAKYQQLSLESAQDLSNSGADKEQAFLSKLRQQLEAELANSDLKAEEVAKAIGMSRSNLYAKVSAVTGLSFNAYLNTLRLQKGKHLLQTTSLNVSEIAYQVGFKDPSYFSRQFTKMFGVAPSKI